MGAAGETIVKQFGSANPMEFVIDDEQGVWMDLGADPDSPD